MAKTVTRLYNTYSEAVAVIRELEAAGVNHNDIAIVANAVDDKKNDPTHKDAAKKGAGGGAAAGGAVGAGAGLLAGIGMLAIPGVGPVVAAGWLTALAAGAAAGATAGAAAGGLIGKMKEHDIDKDDAEVYCEAIRRGAALVSVKINDDNRDTVESIMNRGPYVDIAARRADYLAGDWKGYNPAAPNYTQAQIEAERSRYL